MKITDYLKLNVPELTDSPPDITKISDNFPKIDANAKLVGEQINNLDVELTNIIDGTVKVGDADKLNGSNSSAFVQKLNLTAEIVNRADYPINYIGDFNNVGDIVGLPNGWTHVIYSRHQNTNGYGSQIFQHFDYDWMYIRRSCGTGWQPTKQVANTDTVPPAFHASTGGDYGLGSWGCYGHVKTINALTASSHNDGDALSACQGYLLDQKLKVQSTVPNTSALWAW